MGKLREGRSPGGTTLWDSKIMKEGNCNCCNYRKGTKFVKLPTVEHRGARDKAHNEGHAAGVNRIENARKKKAEAKCMTSLEDWKRVRNYGTKRQIEEERIRGHSDQIRLK